MIEKNAKLNMVFMGPPGVGKGTVASVISSTNEFVHLSTGSIFREEIAKATPLGLKVSEIVKSGKYVTDDITNEIVKNKLTELMSQNKKVILDGYPRTINQAQFLDNIEGFEYVVVSLFAQDDLILKRLSGRRFCPQCKSSYHVLYMPSKLGDKCEKDGVELATRPDDTIEAIKVRQKIYHDETKPLLDFYEQNNRVISVDANGNADDIAKDVLAKVKNN
ncbi:MULTISPECIES: nucleoside monophosphate kinase [unclassified Mycoplasma]|uniref:adenylate kinase family protein n=1 Tax=unclassified Mycoplasma TaxID=2683645 RepID=UPI00216B04F5|nr:MULTISPECIES: nucleoside monophosphate kinase [unclassified Mycoplasma]MCS4537115.1 nucleoside monophosphate kinase [Mycoplasma sp. CSL7475-4]MCT4469849.1 nucleoside monophosphate kinase [Mycoplasma sp. HS2188]